MRNLCKLPSNVSNHDPNIRIWCPPKYFDRFDQKKFGSCVVVVFYHATIVASENWLKFRRIVSGCVPRTAGSLIHLKLYRPPCFDRTAHLKSINQFIFSLFIVCYGSGYPAVWILNLISQLQCESGSIQHCQRNTSKWR